MEEQLRLIAQRICALREIAGVSAEAVATALGIPLSTYLTYESGTADIPVSVLYQLANRFGVDLSSILTGEEPRLHTYCLVRQGKGVRVERQAAYTYQHLAYNFAHKRFEPFLVTVEPKPADTPIALNSHAGQEFTYLIAGAMKLVIDEHELVLRAGDAVYFDASVRHGMQALDGAPAQFLAIIF